MNGGQQILFWMQHGVETPLPEDPKPLKVLLPARRVKAGPLEGMKIPLPPSWRYREVLPCYVWGSIAVYELQDGQYTVTRNGDSSGRPFETSDYELARMVCKQWATELRAERITP